VVAEGVWANMKNGLGNLAAHGLDGFAAVVKPGSNASSTAGAHRGLLAQTGLSFEDEPP
jgi:hypothetical protein